MRSPRARVRSCLLLLSLSCPGDGRCFRVGHPAGWLMREGQATVTTTECQPVAPLGKGSARSSVWVSPSPSVARTSMVWLPGGGVPLVDPLAPGVDRWPRRRARAWCHVAVVDADLDPLDAAVLGPGDAGDGDRAGAELGERRRRVDARHRLDRRLGGPAALDPVRRRSASKVVSSRSTSHLRGRHVAVEAGHDHPHREAVLERQRLAVHPDGEHRVAAVHRDRGRGADGQPVDGAGRPAGRRRVRRRPRSAGRRSGHAEPAGVADVLAADLVGDAGQRDVALDQSAARAAAAKSARARGRPCRGSAGASRRRRPRARRARCRPGRSRRSA